MARNKVGFLLTGVTTEELASLPENYQDGNEVDIHFEASYQLDTDNKGIGSYCKFSFYQQDVPILIAKIGCHFTITDEAWSGSLDLSTNKITLSKTFITHLVVLTVGTARGVIHAKKPKSYLDVYLPTFDVSKMIKEDIVFDLNAEEEEEE